MSYHDLFSAHAKQYAEFRPHYPAALFEFLASIVNERTVAWDCATGNGQTASDLVPYFSRVVATDASMHQLQQATRIPHVNYCAAMAQCVPLLSQTVDLVTISQALHWMPIGLFYSEVQRVLKPNGVFAAWCYSLPSITPEIDAVVSHLYRGIVGPFWSPERKLVEDRYQTLLFPFCEIEVPEFQMELEWTLPEFVGYLGTWSASQKYFKANQKDPIEEILTPSNAAWGDVTQRKLIRWPLSVRVSRK